VARLNTSGLWEDVRKSAEKALAIGYDKVQQARAIESGAYTAYKSAGYDSVDKYEVDKIRAIDERFIKQNKRDTGETYEYVDTEILWHMSAKPRIKKMRFDKYDAYNDEKLKTIDQAYIERKPCHERGRTSYDVSYEYKPDAKKAWYSEEYRGCGNGHYYLALDTTHAWYYEKD
jgi:hypothetical protein